MSPGYYLLIVGLLSLVLIVLLWYFLRFQVLQPSTPLTSSSSGSPADIAPSVWDAALLKEKELVAQTALQQRINVIQDQSLLPEWSLGDSTHPLYNVYGVEANALWILWSLKQGQAASISYAIPQLKFLLDQTPQRVQDPTYAYNNTETLSSERLTLFRRSVFDETSSGTTLAEKTTHTTVKLAYPWYFLEADRVYRPVVSRSHPGLVTLHEPPALEWTIWLLYAVWQYGVVAADTSSRAWVEYHVLKLHDALSEDFISTRYPLSTVADPTKKVMRTALSGTDTTAIYQPHVYNTLQKPTQDARNRLVDRGLYTHLHENFMWVLLLQAMAQQRSTTVTRDFLQPYLSGTQALLAECRFDNQSKEKVTACSCFQGWEEAPIATTPTETTYYLYWGTFVCTQDHVRTCIPTLSEEEQPVDTMVLNCCPAPLKALSLWYACAQTFASEGFTPLDPDVLADALYKHYVTDANLPNGCNAMNASEETQVVPCTPAHSGTLSAQMKVPTSEELRYGFRYASHSDGLHWGATLQMLQLLTALRDKHNLAPDVRYDRFLHNIQSSLGKERTTTTTTTATTEPAASKKIRLPPAFLYGAYRSDHIAYITPLQTQEVNGTNTEMYQKKQEARTSVVESLEHTQTPLLAYSSLRWNPTVCGPLATRLPTASTTLYELWYYRGEQPWE